MNAGMPVMGLDEGGKEKLQGFKKAESDNPPYGSRADQVGWTW